jgi:CHASE2 domain-containing sensor protein
LLLSADATPLPDNLHAAFAWLWLLAGSLLSRPTVHHAAALLGGFLGWGLLAIGFTKSSVLNRSPMMTIAMAMIAVAIYMLVNMSRANKNQHQFS